MHRRRVRLHRRLTELVTRQQLCGARGCTPERDGVTCDDGAQLPGAVCTTEATIACSPDGSSQLVCTGHHVAIASTCRGPGGCSIAADNRLTCDTTRADVGDACEQENGYACARDLKSQLRCREHHFTLVNTCMGPGRCQAKPAETSFDCDDDLATVGDPCEDEGDLACSLDHALRLRCAKGHFADDGSCHPPAHCLMRIEKDLKHFACE